MKTIRRRSFLKKSSLSLAGIGGLASDAYADSRIEKTVIEETNELPVIHETDICVLGGSCTGVFAAIRAARLNAKVALVEKQNSFGGTATSSLVNVWHSPMDTEFKQQIIAGLTLETMERLGKRKAVDFENKNWSRGFTFNSEELKIELDEMVVEEEIKPFLHTFFCAPILKDGELVAVAVENKSGRGAIKAKVFIDATGDGDLCTRLGLPTYTTDFLQPPTTCARFEGWKSLEGTNLSKLLLEHGKEHNLPEGFAWGAYVPDSEVYMLAGTRVYGADCANADDLTRAEIEGRRQVRAIMDIIRKHAPDSTIVLQALPSQIGIRETRHIQCHYQLTGDDVLHGKRFDDAIANGSYRVDIHHQEKPGITFRYLDGTERYVRPGYPTEKGRWRNETDDNPTFYQIPFRSLVPGKYGNLILAGRMLDADKVAFSAVRVMVNMNQTGEAAGVAAYLALDTGKDIDELDAKKVQKLLVKGGSVII